VFINSGDGRDVGVLAGSNFDHGNENVIMEGYSECHWPGGQ
jgi:hypothetical protein